MEDEIIVEKEKKENEQKEEPNQNENIIKKEEEPNQNENIIKKEEEPNQNENVIKKEEEPNQNEIIIKQEEEPNQNEIIIKKEEEPNQNEIINKEVNVEEKKEEQIIIQENNEIINEEPKENEPNKNEIVKESEQKQKSPSSKENNEDNNGLKISRIYIAKTSELNGKTLYHIKGDFLPQDKEVIRRYRDFDLFYKKLCQNWPVIFIPPIPPKIYLSSSTDKKVIDERIYQLENFLQVLSDLPYITQTPEFNLFINPQINNSDNFQAEMKKLVPYNCKQISENYNKLFANHKNLKKKDLTEEKLGIYVEFVNDLILKINEYKKQLVIFGDIDKKKIAREGRIINHFIEFEKNSMKNFTNNDPSLLYFFDNKFKLEEYKTRYENSLNHPYYLLSCWIRLKELELNALKDKLNEYKDYKAKKISYNNKLKDLTQKLNDANSGKVGFFQKIFIKGDIQKLKEKYDTELKSHTEETNYINSIVEILADYIAVEFYRFFDRITHGFYHVVKIFATIQKENAILAKDLWLRVRNETDEDAEKINDIFKSKEDKEANNNINIEKKEEIDNSNNVENKEN